jgi:hypothetical protein
MLAEALAWLQQAIIIELASNVLNRFIFAPCEN